MTRDEAMARANGLEHTFMGRYHTDIEALKLAMKEWLIHPVIQVLDNDYDDYKNSIYMWCLAFNKDDNTILEGVTSSTEDLHEYHYTVQVAVSVCLSEAR